MCKSDTYKAMDIIKSVTLEEKGSKGRIPVTFYLKKRYGKL